MRCATCSGWPGGLRIRRKRSDGPHPRSVVDTGRAAGHHLGRKSSEMSDLRFQIGILGFGIWGLGFMSIKKQSLAGAMVLAALLAISTSVPGQTGYKAPRTADGKPNLNGIWQAMTTAHWDVEAHPAAPGPMWELGAQFAIQGGLGIVEGGAIPYKPEALAKKKENFANRMKLDPEIKCYLPGVPRAMYMPYPFQIIQSQKHIMIVHEYAGAVRTIYMDNHTDAPADSWT